MFLLTINKPYETINGLLLFSVSATAKRYATYQVIHKSNLIKSLLYLRFSVIYVQHDCLKLRKRLLLDVFPVSHTHACSYLGYELSFSSLFSMELP